MRRSTRGDQGAIIGLEQRNNVGEVAHLRCSRPALPGLGGICNEDVDNKRHLPINLSGGRPSPRDSTSLNGNKGQNRADYESACGGGEIRISASF